MTKSYQKVFQFKEIIILNIISYQFYYSCGYITRKGNFLKIPNNEVQSQLMRQIYILKDFESMDPSAFVKPLFQCNVTAFETMFQDFINTIPPILINK